MTQCEETEYEIVVYATSNEGKGRVMEIGRYDSVDEMQDIIISMFSKDTVISFETQKKDEYK